MSSSAARKLALEGVVIVISILMAFALEAWWSDRQEREQVAEMLVLLDEELAENQARLAESRSRRETLVALTDSVVRYGNWRRFPQIVISREDFNSTTSALAALEATGALRLIEDAELKLLIAGLPSDLADLAKAETDAVTRRDRARDRVAEIGNISGRTVENMSDDDPVFSDRIILNLIAMRETDETIALEAAERLQERIRAIRERLAQRAW